MDADRAKSVLSGTRFGALDWVHETGSTNADLVAAARDGAAERVLIADHQHAGRGRLGRVWEAPRGASLLCSMLVRPDISANRLHFVTTAVGLAAAAACAAVAGVELGLKWPNDLVTLGNQPGPDQPGPDQPGPDLKVAGILAETTATAGRIGAVVVGIGINVNWPDELPAELADTATSLRHLASGDIDRIALAAQLIAGTDQWLSVLEAGDIDRIHTAYRRRSATLGRDVRVEVPGSMIEGRAMDIDSDGALQVTSVDGAQHSVGVGDVVHLRPQPQPQPQAPQPQAPQP